MELIIIAVVILAIFAVTDLIVGVSNDAVNFLNSAIGSKAAPRWIILTIASAGILFGTTFSTGLMEVARKGIFHPEMFMLPEIMTIFLAVMLTDVLLLDLFNTFGLPTSTTVSIVFELLGAAVAVSFIKILSSDQTILDLQTYINSEKAFAIISGILLSVAIAFTVGAIVQYISRLIFTFDYEKKLKRYGAIWGSVALTAILFFILIKGAKHSSFMSSEIKDWIKINTLNIILTSVVFWTIVLQFVIWFTRVNILKIIILVGTFALALAFAANDLVNFIGVPLAGLASYEAALEVVGDPSKLLMTALSEPVQTSTFLLLLAGLIMAVTLWFSKKAQTVTKTEINLGRQSEGFERFESSLLARKLVKTSMLLSNNIKKIVPFPILTALDKRFENANVINGSKNSLEAPSFDLIRASVNLMVASILISFATNLKLPLSTTYVTFMVAMGTSLADRAWGRESAVYRVTGVITVIGGWFFTALSAFTAAAVVATVLYYGEIYALVIFVLFAGYILIKSHVLHKKREEADKELEDFDLPGDDSSELEGLNSTINNNSKLFKITSSIIENSVSALINEDLDKLADLKNDVKKHKKRVNQVINSIFEVVKLQSEESTKKEKRYGKIIGALQEIQSNTFDIWQSCYTHINNHHRPPGDSQRADLKEITSKLLKQVELTEEALKNIDNYNEEQLNKSIEKFEQSLSVVDQNQILRIKTSEGSVRRSILFLDLIADLENISNQVSQLFRLYVKNYSGLKQTEN